jgi:hypothetical protein
MDSTQLTIVMIYNWNILAFYLTQINGTTNMHDKEGVGTNLLIYLFVYFHMEILEQCNICIFA